MRDSSSIALYLVLLVLGLLACTRNQDEMDAPPLPADRAQAPVAPTATPPTAPPAPAASDSAHIGGSNPLNVTSANGLSYVSDRSGQALYYVEGDTDGSKCSDACVDTWPPLLVTDAVPTGGAGLNAGDIGTITRPDGRKQATFRQHPLYRYGGDAGAGSTAGDDVQDKWGHWHVAAPQAAKAAAAPAGQ